MTPEEAEAEMGRDLILEEGAASPSCRYARPEDGPKGVAFMIIGGVIVRVDIFMGSPVKTLSGIGIGSTAQEVKKAYPDRIKVKPHPYLGDRGSYLVYVPTQQRQLSAIFETDRGVVDDFRSGYTNAVAAIEGCA